MEGQEGSGFTSPNLICLKAAQFDTYTTVCKSAAKNWWFCPQIIRSNDEELRERFCQEQQEVLKPRKALTWGRDEEEPVNETSRENGIIQKHKF